MVAPLEGIRILDFTRYQNGPHATVMLSDMGADVLKVEMPGSGDPGRSLGRLPNGFCGYFEGHNRGKRSMTLDIRKPEGQEVVRRLVPTVDVITENFRPGFLDSLGLGYEELRKLNERLIYATNSGFGPKGEWRDRGSFDIVAQGMSGAMVSQAGGPGNEPQNIGWGLADQVGSMVFAYGVMAAVVSRERFGVGQKLDVSQLGAMLTLQSFVLTGFMHTGQQASNPGGRPFNPTFGWYQAADGEWLTVGVLDPRRWPNLCRAVEREDLIEDKRSVDAFVRQQNAEWLRAELTQAFSCRPRSEWLDRLVAEEVPCGPVYDYASVVADQQFWENGYLEEIEHPHFEGHRVVGNPVVLSETPGGVQGPAPELGQHTEAVLLDVGYSWEEIERLHDLGVTAAR
jgi:CoA:oxalate CoA-transferase